MTAALIRSPALGIVGVPLAFCAIGAISLGMASLNLSLIPPLAFSRIRAYTTYQVGYYGIVLGSVLIGVAIHADTRLMVSVIAGGSCGYLIYYVYTCRGQRLGWLGDREFVQIAGTTLLAASLFSAFERLDLFYVAASASTSAAGEYGVAVRAAGGLT